MPEKLRHRKRVRAAHRLSALKITKLKEPGLYEDGAGLRLVVTEKGVKRWAMRVTIDGRRVERGLGVWPSVDLDDARRQAEAFRRAARAGMDARAEARRVRRANAITFRDAFAELFDVRRQQLTNTKHVKQWGNTMRDYVFPLIGNRPVAEITAGDVLNVLRPIWYSKPETASRVMQRMKATFDSAILRGNRVRANPCIGVVGELGTKHRVARHHHALPWQHVPQFVLGLRRGCTRTATRLALEFLVLTAARSGEVRNAAWPEMDMERRLWTIPASRMKGRESHVVPLSLRAIELLGEARALYNGPIVFPGSKGQPLTDNALSKLMRDDGVSGTPHGFRSSFKDWAAEHGVRDEVSEAALAHADANPVRAAYRRTRFLEERVGLMQRWCDFVCDTRQG